LIILNAVFGICLVEFAWSKLTECRYLDLDEERDKLFPAFRRNDVKKWNRWKFYPMGMTLLPMRWTISLFGTLLFGSFWSWILRIGRDETKPLLGWRLYLIKAYF